MSRSRWNHPQVRRGVELRLRLLAYVRRYSSAGRPLPSHVTIGADLGVSSAQVCRHLGLLKDAGLVEIQRRECVYFANFPNVV